MAFGHDAIMGVRRGGAKWAFPPLEIGSKNHTFLENLKSALLFRLIDLIPAMTVYLTVIHSSLILRVARSFDIFSRTFFQCVSVSGVKRSGDARDDSLIVCPGPLTGGGSRDTGPTCKRL